MYYASSLDDVCSHNWKPSETGAGVIPVRGVCCSNFSYHHIFSPEFGKWLLLDGS